MADDGLLLNFSASDSPLRAKSHFAGGRWKDRLTAKKAASNWQKSQARKPIPEDQDSTISAQAGSPQEYPPVDTHDRPSKRPRLENASIADRLAHDAHGNARVKHSKTNKQQDHQSTQFVSSLFTSNPKPQTGTDHESGILVDTPIAPSNAPLTSELENFTALGLSSVLASHLLKKLEIKSPTAIQKEAVTHLVRRDTDAFLQAETGSGKTLAYLLPIVQRLMELSTGQQADQSSQSHTKIHRDSGLFALVLAPTRELCKQISAVLESLLRCAHWIVAGSVAGGENKKSEKARLRKGLNILVATPGRLADHLANTQVLDLSRVRWLVLDEGDRLMELGFEKDIQKILSNLNLQSKKTQTSDIPGLPGRRVTILCSATMKMDVQRLGDISLKSPAFIKVDPKQDGAGGQDKKNEKDSFSAPAQLKQSYAVVPAKLRLVSLVAVLKRAFARKGSVTKAIVFLSCADSVNFHFDLFAHNQDNAEKSDEPLDDANVPHSPKNPLESSEARTCAKSPTLSHPENPVQIFRLHGSLPQSRRTSTLSAYSKSSQAAVLLCTDVVSRGLDVPNVDFIVEYDPAFSQDDHLHRIGRTARAGRDGRALVFLLPGDEQKYVQVLKQDRHDAGVGIARHDVEEILQKGFGVQTRESSSRRREWEDRATDWQLDAERRVQESAKNLEQARRAFQSHVRAYATHVAAERHFFNIKTLHLGHLAKAFALRDKPGSMRVPGLRPGKDEVAKNRLERKAKAGAKTANQAGNEDVGEERPERRTMTSVDTQEAAQRMQAKIKQMSAVSEFNLG